MLRRVLTGQQMSVLGGARGIRLAVARLPNMRLSTSAAAAPAEAPAGEAAPAAVEEVADFNKPYSSSPAALTWSAWLELKQQQEKLYDQVDLGMDELKRAEFFPDLWTAQHNEHNPLRRSLRALVAKHTMQVTATGTYHTALPGTDQLVKVELSVPVLKAALRNTHVYESSLGLALKEEDTAKAADIRVLNGDVLDCAFDLKRAGYSPLVLVPNSSVGSGGLWLKGSVSTGVEEELYRRTALCRAIRKQHLPVPLAGAVYSPNVIVFRAGLSSGYRLLSEPYCMSFVAVEQFRKPKLRRLEDETLVLPAYMVTGMKNKFRTILRIAKTHGHNALVLPAFGGANFKNPPRHVASIWKSVLAEAEFANQVPAIRFALTDDFAARPNWNPDGTLRPYLEVFDAPTGYVPPAAFQQPI